MKKYVIPEIDMNDAVFFTGPRPAKLAGYDGNYDGLINYLSDYIENEVLPSKHTFISGAAQGFDQIAAEVVDDLKKRHPNEGIRNVIMVPYPNQDCYWSIHGQFGRMKYKKMLNKADIVYYVSSDNPSSNRQASKFLFNRNSAMAANASMCIGLWPDGDDTWKLKSTKGGTADSLRKCAKDHTEVRLIRYSIEDNAIRPVRTDVIRN